MTIDHNSPEGRCYYLLREVFDSGVVPEELEDKVRDALAAIEINEAKE